jgi:hypothetical protein
MTRVRSSLCLDFQVAHPEKFKKSCVFKGLHSLAKSIPDSSVRSRGIQKTSKPVGKRAETSPMDFGNCVQNDIQIEFLGRQT